MVRSCESTCGSLSWSEIAVTVLSARVTRLACAPTACDTYANFPSSETTTARGSLGSDTSNDLVSLPASNAVSARPQPLVTRSVASSGVSASATGSIGVSMAQRFSSSSGFAPGSITTICPRSRSSTARRPSGKNMSCEGRPSSAVSPSSLRASTSTTCTAQSSSSAV